MTPHPFFRHFLLFVFLLQAFYYQTNAQSWKWGVNPLGTGSYTEIQSDNADNVIINDSHSGGATSTLSNLFKLDSSGNLIWTMEYECRPHTIGGYFSGILSHSIDLYGNTYVLSTAPYRIGTTTFSAPAPATALSKLAPDGRLMWVKKISDIRSSQATVNCDSTGSPILILHSDAQPFVLTDSVLSFTSLPQDTRLWISKLDSAGSMQWARWFGTPKSYSYVTPTGSGIVANNIRPVFSVSPGGDIFIAGTFLDTINILGTRFDAPFIAPTQKKAGFMALLDKNGNLQYAKQTTVASQYDEYKKSMLFSSNKTIVAFNSYDTTINSSIYSKSSVRFIDAAGNTFREISMSPNPALSYSIMDLRQSKTSTDFFLVGNLGVGVLPNRTLSFQVKKLDSSGTITFEKTLPPSGFNSTFGYGIAPGVNHTFVTGTLSGGSSGDNITFNQSVISLPTGRTSIGFIAAMKEGANKVSGRVYYDLNGNAIFDAGDSVAAFQILRTNQQNFIITDSEGKYTVYLPEGDFNDTLILPPYHTATPTSFSYTFSGTDSTINGQDFRLNLQPGVTDLQVMLYPATAASYSSQSRIRMIFKNVGTVPASGQVTLRLGDLASYSGSSIAPSFSSPDSAVWNFVDLQPQQYNLVDINIQYSTGPLGTLIKTIASVTPSQNDNNTSNNTDTLFQQLIGSYDPNNKLSNPINILNRSTVASGSSYIDYFINFENTGTDTARQVTITDELSPLLDENSLQILSSTHNVVPSYNNGALTFIFPQINLPDSNVNKLAACGGIHFRLKVKSDLVDTDTIKNSASIVFDENPAIITNTTFNYFGIEIEELNLVSFTGYKTQHIHHLTWTTAGEGTLLEFAIERSIDGSLFTSIGSITARHGAGNEVYYWEDTETSFPGIYQYRLKMVEADGSISYSDFVTLENSIQSLIVFPNPTKDILNMHFYEPASGIVNVKLIDMVGRIVLQKKVQSSAGLNTLRLNTSLLARGMYQVLKDGKVAGSVVLNH